MMTKGRAIQAYRYTYKLVLETPNDDELGKKVREHYKEINDEFSENN